MGRDVGGQRRSSGPGELLSVAFDEPGPGVLAAHLSGGLDLSTAPELDALMQEHLFRSHPRRLVLDLAGLRFIDLRGVAVLTRTLRRATASRTRLYLASVPPLVVRVLRFADALALFGRVPDVADAVPAPRAGPARPGRNGRAGSSRPVTASAGGAPA